MTKSGGVTSWRRPRVTNFSACTWKRDLPVTGVTGNTPLGRETPRRLLCPPATRTTATRPLAIATEPSVSITPLGSPDWIVGAQACDRSGKQAGASRSACNRASAVRSISDKVRTRVERVAVSRCSQPASRCSWPWRARWARSSAFGASAAGLMGIFQVVAGWRFQGISMVRPSWAGNTPAGSSRHSSS